METILQKNTPNSASVKEAADFAEYHVPVEQQIRISTAERILPVEAHGDPVSGSILTCSFLGSAIGGLTGVLMLGSLKEGLLAGAAAGMVVGMAIGLMRRYLEFRTPRNPS